VYGIERWQEVEKRKSIVIPLKPRARSRPVCSRCGKACPCYDTLKERLFRFVPFWGFMVFFAYAMRRVDCPTCGVRVEKIPWGDGKKQTTNTYAWFIAHWAKLLSWQEVARQFQTSWGTVWRSVEHAVEWGRANMPLEGITAIGIDEIARSKGHKYITLVYQIAGTHKRLLWVAENRTEESIRGFFDWLNPTRSRIIEFVCSDMWKPYLKVINEKASQAVQVLDRFHIMTHFSKAIDEVRANEARVLAERNQGHVMKHSRWLDLKRPENLTDKQSCKLKDLMKMNLKTIKAYLLKEQFNLLWEYSSPHWAGVFLKSLTFRAMRSKIEPIKKVAKMIRRHEGLILNWFRSKGEISNGVVEGMNGKGRVCTKRTYGFRTFRGIQIALYHALGDLPTPEFTHRFW
ncbi:MAG: ISL3 family transposase, partial [bacterium]